MKDTNSVFLYVQKHQLGERKTFKPASSLSSATVAEVTAKNVIIISEAVRNEFFITESLRKHLRTKVPNLRITAHLTN